MKAQRLILEGDALRYKGDWVSGNEYHENDAVTYSGSLYECILGVKNSTSSPSSDTTHFLPMTSNISKYTTTKTVGTTANVKELFRIASIARSATAIVYLKDSNVPCNVIPYDSNIIVFSGGFIDGKDFKKAKYINFDINSTGEFGVNYCGKVDINNGAITIENLTKSSIQYVEITYLANRIL